MSKNKTQTHYLKFTDEGQIEWVGCMVCNHKIAQREIHPKTQAPYLKHMSHMKTKLLPLNDGSKLEILLCPDCENTALNYEHIERTVRWGFMQECLAAVGPRPELKKITARVAAFGRKLKLKEGQ